MTSRLPLIDFSLFDVGGAWRDHVAAQVDRAASEFGFFYILGHGVESGVIDSLLSLSRTFFEQNAQAKEGLCFGNELAEDGERSLTSLHGRAVFPALPGFREAVLDYRSALTGLGHRLMTSIGRGLRLGDNYFVDRYTGSPTTLFRIFNDPSATAATAATAADARDVSEHTDHGLLTLLYQDEVGGLQAKHGSSWIDVPFVPGSFVVSVGDMLERFTAGRYTSALHRVINTAGRSRLSLSFFFDPRFDATLRPIAEGVPGAARFASSHVPCERRAQV